MRLSDIGTSRRSGFTLAEAIVSIVIVGVMMVTALNLVAASARARQINARLGEAPALAHDLMSEILQARYKSDSTVEVEGSEQLLASHTASSNLKDAKVEEDAWWAQTIKPVVSDDAVSWRVTRVQFLARKEDDSTTTQVRLCLPAADGTPSDTVIARVDMSASELTSSYAWIDKTFADAGGLKPNSGICVAFKTSDDKSSRLRYDDKATSMDGAVFSEAEDGKWTPLDASSMLLFYLYGTVTTPDDSHTSWGPESPETADTRADWDDVDDYDDWSASPPESKDGTQLTEYAGWSRAVKVEYVSPTAPNGSAVGDDQGVKRITVTVTDPRGAKTTLVGLRSADGAFEQEVDATKTYVSWVGLDLQIGDANTPLSMGTTLVNEPEDE